MNHSADRAHPLSQTTILVLKLSVVHETTRVVDIEVVQLRELSNSGSCPTQEVVQLRELYLVNLDLLFPHTRV